MINTQETRRYFVTWMKNCSFKEFSDQLRLLIELGHVAGYDGTSKSLRSLEDSIRSPSDRRFEDAVASYQRFSSVSTREGERQVLSIDGNFGPVTKTSVNQRFCGCRDIEYAGGQSKWSFTDLTVWSRINDNQLGLGTSTWDRWFSAVSVWAKYTPLTYRKWQESDGNNGPNIYVDAKEIDRAGGVLAYDYLPTPNAPRTEKNQMVIDTSENWTQWDYDFFKLVVEHEGGHAIGLNHIPNQGSNLALMNPYIQRLSGPQPRDIAAAQALYGDQPPPPPPPPPPPEAELMGTINYQGYLYTLLRKEIGT